MMDLPNSPSERFRQLLEEIPTIGKSHHEKTLVQNALRNKAFLKHSVKELKLSDEKAHSAIVISAGPSVKRRNSIQRVKDLNYKGTIICADGAYVSCLKAGLIPDFVLSLDPHPTRMVRWFGDPDFEKHSAQDDYFARQDLDTDFRANSIRHNNESIEYVNKYGKQTKAILCSVCPETLVKRVESVGFETYWWNPLVDDPSQPESLTRQLYNVNKLPCFNTGGNVGTASWVFAASMLKIPHIAIVGMDFGYYADLPLENTQYYYELLNKTQSLETVKEYFQTIVHPDTKEVYYTDPPYAWYRQNFLELLKVFPSQTYNCSEGGTLFADNITFTSLENFVKNLKK